MARTRLWVVATLVGPILALGAIWWPLFSHYHVADPAIDADVVSAARQPLTDGLRRHLEPAPGSGVPVGAQAGEAVEKAERLLATGRLQLGAFAAETIALPFDPLDLERGSVSWRLQVAALVVPRLFMDAYRESGRRQFLRQAREALLGFARFERDQWLPRGLLWNDHAVAARVRVLARFWQIHREHPDLLESHEAREILALAARSLELTAKPSFYTPRTNHGIFQDLALWLGYHAFPGLPAAEDAAEVAYERFARHLPYYLGPEGVVLEHSAGYHRVGLGIIGRAFWFMDLAGQEIRDDWWQRYRRAMRFYRLLHRPDGTLPRFGDTHPRGGVRIASRTSDGSVRLEPYEPGLPEESGLHLYPVAGYAIDWRGLSGAQGGDAPGQMVLTWSRFPMHGHKHADELALHYWARGVDWWTSVGYWPYGHRGRDAAEGWTSTNAPHHVGEGPESRRETFLMGKVPEAENVRFLDLRRTGPDYGARRQVISLPGGTRAVLDTAEHRDGRPTREVWRVGPAVGVRRLDDGVFRLRGSRPEQRLTAWFRGAGSIRAERGTGAGGVVGMVVDDRRPVATTSLVLDRPSGGEPTLVGWHPGSVDARGPEIARWQGPEDWHIRLPGAHGAWNLERSGRELVAAGPSGDSSRLRVEPGPAVDAARSEIVSAFEAMKAEYGGFRALVHYRFKTTWVAGGLFLLHLVGLPVLAYLSGTTRLASCAILAGWGAYVLWLRLYYFPF